MPILLPPALAQMRAAPASARRAAGAPSVLRQAVGRCGFPNGAGLTSRTSWRTRLGYTVPAGGPPLIDAVVAFGNFSTAHAPESAPSNAGKTIRAAIEYPIGTTLTQLYCRGSKDMVLAPDTMGQFDPCGLYIPAGASFRVVWRELLSATSETNYTTYIPQGVSGDGYAWDADTGTIDNTADIGATYGTQNQLSSLAPIGIYGRANGGTGLASILIVGDSIATGTGESSVVAHGGFIARAIADTRPYAYISKPSMQASQFLNTLSRRLRVAGRGGFTHAICNMGVNDVNNGRTLPQMQTDLLRIWQIMSDFGLPVWQTTLTPKTASTDSWATTANQTPSAAWTADTGIGHQLNDWIRTIPAPLSGIFETADAAMTARNSGVWKAGYVYTTDGFGLHPNATGHAAMAAVLAPQVTGWTA